MTPLRVVVEIEVALKSARFWGDYALRRASWGDAIEAYGLAQEASERLCKDVSTIMLMFVFYHTRREGRKEPAATLRDAQLWMRDSTNREKADYFKAFLPEFGGHGRNEAAASHLYRTAALLPKAGRDFAHPDDLAAFCYFGV